MCGNFTQLIPTDDSKTIVCYLLFFKLFVCSIIVLFFTFRHPCSPTPQRFFSESKVVRIPNESFL